MAAVQANDETALGKALIAHGKHVAVNLWHSVFGAPVLGEPPEDLMREARLVARMSAKYALTADLAMLGHRGACVLFGGSGGYEATFDVRRFFMIGGATLYGFSLFEELEHTSAGVALTTLARMAAEGRLKCPISIEEPWEAIGAVAARLMNREFTGKAVLHL